MAIMTFVLKVGREDASAAAAECAICEKEKEPPKENASHSVLLLLPLLCPAAIEIESETGEKNILEEGEAPRLSPLAPTPSSFPWLRFFVFSVLPRGMTSAAYYALCIGKRTG